MKMWISTLILMALPVWADPACHESLEDAPVPDSFLNEAKYTHETIEIQRVTDVNDYSFLAIVDRSISYQSQKQTFRSSFVGIQYMDQAEGTMIPRAFDPEREKFRSIAHECVDATLQIYALRREHWGPALFTKLRETADKYLDESKYIFVRDADGKIRGNLRLIQEKDGLLPVEDYLGIRFNSQGLIKVEPGNFSVDKDFNAQVLPEIFIQLATWRAQVYGRTSSELLRKAQYYTYADDYSLHLYSRLGFKAVPLAELKLQPGVIYELMGEKPEEGVRIFKDGVWWTPMQASQAKMGQLYEREIEKIRRLGQVPYAFELQARADAAMDNTRPGGASGEGTKISYVGKATIDGRMYKCGIHWYGIYEGRRPYYRLDLHVDDPQGSNLSIEFTTNTIRDFSQDGTFAGTDVAGHPFTMTAGAHLRLLDRIQFKSGGHDVDAHFNNGPF